jgi:hypothetical protein
VRKKSKQANPYMTTPSTASSCATHSIFWDVYNFSSHCIVSTDLPVPEVYRLRFFLLAPCTVWYPRYSYSYNNLRAHGHGSAWAPRGVGCNPDSALSRSSGSGLFVNFLRRMTPNAWSCPRRMKETIAVIIKKHLRIGPKTVVLFYQSQTQTDASSISSTPKFERNEGPS